MNKIFSKFSQPYFLRRWSYALISLVLWTLFGFDIITEEQLQRILEHSDQIIMTLAPVVATAMTVAAIKANPQSDKKPATSNPTDDDPGRHRLED